MAVLVTGVAATAQAGVELGVGVPFTERELVEMLQARSFAASTTVAVDLAEGARIRIRSGDREALADLGSLSGRAAARVAALALLDLAAPAMAVPVPEPEPDPVRPMKADLARTPRDDATAAETRPDRLGAHRGRGFVAFALSSAARVGADVRGFGVELGAVFGELGPLRGFVSGGFALAPGLGNRSASLTMRSIPVRAGVGAAFLEDRLELWLGPTWSPYSLDGTANGLEVHDGGAILGLGAMADWLVPMGGAISLLFEAGCEVPLERKDFRVRDVSVLRTDAASARLGAGLRWSP